MGARVTHWIPTPSRACPYPADCFYCRWYTQCPMHFGEEPDWITYTDVVIGAAQVEGTRATYEQFETSGKP